MSESLSGQYSRRPRKGKFSDPIYSMGQKKGRTAIKLAISLTSRAAFSKEASAEKS